MKKNRTTLRILIGLLVLMCIGVTSNALASGGTGWSKIEMIYVHDGWTMVKMQNMTDNPDSCGSTSYYALDPSKSNYKVIHSTLMSAFLAGKSARFWLYGCGGQNDKYPDMVSVWVKN